MTEAAQVVKTSGELLPHLSASSRTNHTGAFERRAERVEEPACGGEVMEKALALRFVERREELGGV